MVYDPIFSSYIREFGNQLWESEGRGLPVGGVTTGDPINSRAALSFHGLAATVC
jgi:hypothetical protein